MLKKPCLVILALWVVVKERQRKQWKIVNEEPLRFAEFFDSLELVEFIPEELDEDWWRRVFYKSQNE